MSYLAAAALGLVACGATLVWAAASGSGAPSSGPVVTAAHFCVLATLSMAVLGALHQFTPVVTQRPLRSVALGRATFVTWLGASWLLPLGVAVRVEGVVEAGGGLAAVAVALLVVNLSAPLRARGKGPPVTGLRLALVGFVVTACFGVLFVADRRGEWFDLSGHVVLAHAVIGLFAWLGLTYVSVAEKLWPMFFLAHVGGRRRAGWIAVWTLPVGAVVLSPGLLVGDPALAWCGASIIAVGLGAHLCSLLTHTRFRRRKADLHLLFVITSAAWLPVGAGLALAGVLVIPASHDAGTGLVAAAVVALVGWLLEAVVAHVHKVVPFIAWSGLRARGIDKGSTGRPLMFGDLYGHRAAALTYALVTAATAALCVGFGISQGIAIAVGGCLLAAAGVLVAANLCVPSARLLARGSPRPVPPPPGAAVASSG